MWVMTSEADYEPKVFGDINLLINEIFSSGYLEDEYVKFCHRVDLSTGPIEILGEKYTASYLLKASGEFKKIFNTYCEKTREDMRDRLHALNVGESTTFTFDDTKIGVTKF